MKRFIILIISILFLLILFLGFYLNSNHFKKTLTDKIEAISDGKLIIEDQLNLSFYPFLSLTAYKVVLENPSGFGNKPFFKFDKVSFSIKFIPLLIGKIALSKIIVHNGQINIIRNREGKTNWQVVLEKIKEKNSKSNLLILPKTIDIKHVDLNIIDLKNNQTSLISDINFTIRPKHVSLSDADENNDYLDELELNGKLNIAKINARHFKVNNIKASFEGKKNSYSFSPLTALLYEGRFQGSAGVKIIPQKRNYFLKGSFQQIDVQKLFKDLFNYNRILGTGELTIDLSATSIDPDKITPSVNGSMKFNIKNGDILGINFPSILNIGSTLIKTITIIPLIAQSQQSQKTNFGIMRGSAKIKNGILINRDLYILTKDIEIRGEGKIDLVHKKINYVMRLKPRGKNITVYANFNGPLGNPEIKVVKPSAVPLLLQSILPLPV